MTIWQVSYYYGFPMTWGMFSKVFLKKNIDEMYRQNKWGEYVDVYQDEVYDVCAEYTNDEPQVYGLHVTRYPHDLADQIDSLKNGGPCVMVGLPVQTFNVEDIDPTGEGLDDGVTTYLHRPIFEYHFSPDPENIILAKKEWERIENEHKAEFPTTGLKPRLHISADDCSCCS